jgi:hypothetical protein
MHKHIHALVKWQVARINLTVIKNATKLDTDHHYTLDCPQLQQLLQCMSSSFLKTCFKYNLFPSPFILLLLSTGTPCPSKFIFLNDKACYKTLYKMYHKQRNCQSPPPKKTDKVEGKGLNLETLRCGKTTFKTFRNENEEHCKSNFCI